MAATSTTSSTSTAFNPAVPARFCNTAPPPQVLAQGAEGVLIKSYFLSPAIPCAIKYRPAKAWRHPTLDTRLTRHRILSEARILVKCRRDGISVPGVLALDWDGGAEAGAGDVFSNRANAASSRTSTAGGWMMVEWIDGLTVRQTLNGWLPKHKNVQKEPGEDEMPKHERPQVVKDLMRRIGHEIGRMHQTGVIHGDLTTSNIMIRKPSASSSSPTTTVTTTTTTPPQSSMQPPLEGDVVLIDFGLATQSSQEEDRAVDLYVLERAFGSTHPNAEDLFDELLDAYGRTFKAARIALRRLEDVRLRGRKKSMLG